MSALRRVVIAVAVLAVVVGIAGGGAGASERTSSAAKTTAKWAVGDCYSSANVDFDLVTLSSKVACTKSHMVQIVGGAKLPANLASLGLTALKTGSATVRKPVIDFANSTCSPSTVVANLYPKTVAKSLAQLFVSHDVTEWVPPAAGRLGWVFPDQTSFDAGATDVVCIFEPNARITGSTVGDIRRISTKDPLATLRLCYDFNAANNGTNYTTCAKAHDEESLVWINQSIAGHPAKVADWKDADWAPYDATCAELAKVIIGAQRSDLVIRADSDGALASTGRWTFDCVVIPKDKTAAFPGGTIVTGLGKATIKFVKT